MLCAAVVAPLYLDLRANSRDAAARGLRGGERARATVCPLLMLQPMNEGAEPHAYCVVYSQSDLASFRRAEDELQRLWTSGCVGTKAVILVANKTDLVRSRTVTAEGKRRLF